MAKKQKKEEYVELNGVLGNAFDYHVYHMQFTDYLIAWILGFVLAMVVILIFFGSVIFGAVAGVLVAIKAPKFYAEFRKNQRLKSLREQFKDLLESLSASYSAGRNTPDACNDMISIYGEESDIVRELELICTGLNNNINIEVLLTDFAERSGLDDVMSFANVFEVCNRQGGDLKRVVNQTRDVISDKMEIEMEIDTMVAGNKNELNVMMVMPLLIVGMMKGMGISSIGTNTPANVVIKVICIGIFGLAYVMGSRITDIKI